VKDTEEEDDTDEPDDETLSLSTICYRPHLMSASALHSLAPRDTQQQTSPLSITSRLHTAEASEPQISRGEELYVYFFKLKISASLETQWVGMYFSLE
ncbi:SH2 domain-containing protein 4A, partial [Tachysurus ichikawai]